MNNNNKDVKNTTGELNLNPWNSVMIMKFNKKNSRGMEQELRNSIIFEAQGARFQDKTWLLGPLEMQL